MGAKEVSVVLNRDNSNQEEWHDSIQAYCQKRSTLKFLYQRYNVSRPVAVTDIHNVPVRIKMEANAAAGGQGAQAGNQQAQVQAHVVYQNNNELDAIERRTLESARVYLDPERSTAANEVIESDEMHALRFETYDAICRTLIYHKRQVKVCEKGNIHRLITLCMRNIVITPRTIYMNTCALLRFMIRPNESVIDLINKIDAAQQDAIMMGNQAITEDLKIGALLNAVAEDNRFKSLAETFSLATCTLDYQQMCDELIKHELHKVPATHNRQRQVAYQVTSSGPQHLKNLAPEPKKVQYGLAYNELIHVFLEWAWGYIGKTGKMFICTLNILYTCTIIKLYT